MDFKIQPVTFADVHQIAKIGREGFLDDRQTQLKELGDISYTEEKGVREMVRGSLRSKRQVCIKAVDGSGEILGNASFIFQGFSEEDIPRGDPGIDSPEQEKEKAVEQPKTAEKIRANEMIAKMEAMEDEDMRHWQNVLSPFSSKCIIVGGLGVARRHQYRGVGSALLNWATDLADEHNVYMWVHSSEAAFRAYLKAGFKVVGTLDVDLDAWAPGPPKDEGEAAIWGHYLIRYMKRPSRGG